ncbi:MAG: DUF2974 domain-containing protein [Firmicutes bacterium]|jgi:hypothetical protein|nr:DUF2974 domain-containing protein [Bacillota bacterium]
MSNLLTYIEFRGDLPFNIDPVNKVDNLIFSRLAYIDFDDIEENGETLKSISKRYSTIDEKWDNLVFVTEEVKPLLEDAALNKRYENIKVKDFVNIIDEKIELQFSAVCFQLDMETVYVAFRGTDDTLVGWKEDLNMIYLDSIPAQEKAKEYLEDIIKSNDYKNVYIGGHSKGGNLAVYSSINLDSNYQYLIKGVYNNDGPGFKESITWKPEYINISDKIFTLTPQNSIVGLFLENNINRNIVKTTESQAFEHNTFTWIVSRNDFKYVDEINDNIKFVDTTSRNALQRLSDEQRKTFVDVVYLILSSNENKRVTDLNKGMFSNFIEASKKFRALDDDTKKAVDFVLSSFFQEGYNSFLEVTELNKIKDKFMDWSEESKNEISGFFERLSIGNNEVD